MYHDGVFLGTSAHCSSIGGHAVISCDLLNVEFVTGWKQNVKNRPKNDPLVAHSALSGTSGAKGKYLETREAVVRWHFITRML